MSQAGLINAVESTPSIPTEFDADIGIAIPVANVLNILGGTNISTSASGNTITIDATGGGDVVGTPPSTDNAIARYDGITGLLIQNSNVVITDSGAVQAISGTSLEPSFSYTGDSDTGLYNNAAGQQTITCNNTDIFTWTQFGVSTLKLFNFYSGYTQNYVTPGGYPYSVSDGSACTVLVDSSSSRTINLPNSPSDGRVFFIKDAGGLAGTNNITVTTPGGVVLIDGAATYTMNVNYGSLTVQWVGTKYVVI